MTLELLLASTLLAAETPGLWEASLPKAQSAARAASVPVLVDFTAPWCYSCYYMEKNVLSRPEFLETAKGIALARVDVDTPEGGRLKREHRVTMLPSFLVLSAAGQELGRILGEHTEADFLAELKRLAGDAAKTPADRAVDKLATLLGRGDWPAAEKFALGIDNSMRPSLEARADWKRLIARLNLRLKPGGDTLARLLELDDSCELPWQVDGALDAKLPAEAILAIRPKYAAWAEQHVFGPAEARCADFRTGAEVLAGLSESAGDEPGRKAALARAADTLAAQWAAKGIGEDRNLDDNYRYFLEKAGRDAELEALFPKLVDAYPADYVYAHRFAKWLLSKDRAADALPWSEKAARLAYGANRLAVTGVQSDILAKLGRAADAKALLKRDIKAGEGHFPTEAKALKERLAALK